jgi:uncharacterized membrane protein YciS (DUF1049 family)
MQFSNYQIFFMGMALGVVIVLFFGFLRVCLRDKAREKENERRKQEQERRYVSRMRMAFGGK